MKLKRVLARLGHQVRLLPAQYVRPFVRRAKNDRTDAEAINDAASRPGMPSAAVKTAQHQAELIILKHREMLVARRLTRHQFGRRSEQLGADQRQLGLEDLEQTIGPTRPRRMRSGLGAPAGLVPSSPAATTARCRRTCRLRGGDRRR